MRYVVTGGGGFVGSHLVNALLKLNKEVVVIDKISNHSNLQSLNSKKVKYYFADLSDPDLTKKIIQKHDTVFHLAAQSHVDVSFNSPLKTTISNVLGTHSVLNACLENESHKLVIMSTDEVYGSAKQIENLNLLDPTNPYSASKAAADMVANSYRHMYKDFNYTTLRSNNIIGTGQFIRNIIPRFSCLGILGKKMTLHGDGSATRRYLWVDDVVNALLVLAGNDTKDYIYNIGHDVSYSNIQIAKLIGDYLNLEDYIKFEKDRIYNDSYYPCDFSLIQKEFGWRYTKNLEDVLPEIIDWYKKNIDLYEKFFL